MAGAEHDDLRLGPNSPCIDSGDNSTLPSDLADLDGDGDTDELIPLDLAGAPRVVNDAVDMGAYEMPDDELAACWGLTAPDGSLVYPPPPNPVDPVDYMAWLNQIFGAGIGDNAADDYLAAFERIGEFEGTAEDGRELRTLLLTGRWTGNKKIRSWIDASRSGLADFRTAAAKSRCFWPVGGSLGGYITPDLRKHSVAVSALIAEGWQEWFEENMQRLPDNALAILRDAHHLESQFTPMQHDAAWRAAALAYVVLRNALAVADDQDAFATELLSQLTEADPVPSGSGILAALGRLTSYHVCQQLFTPGTQPGTWIVNRAEFEETVKAVGAPEERQALGRLTTQLDEIGFEGTLREYDRCSDALDTWWHTPYHEATTQYDQIVRMFMENENPLPRMVALRTWGARIGLEHRVASRRGTHLVFHVFVHRGTAGRFPSSLDELDAAGLAELRIDPFSGKDFVYKRSGDTFTLYSVADNLKDDGGQHDSSWEDGDFVFWPVQE